MTVAVVLPAFNEAGNLAPLLRELTAVSATMAVPARLLVVNDGSTDGTAAELTELQRELPALQVVTHPSNRGFAAAVKTGIAEASAADFDVMVFLDSDLSHRPADLPKLVNALAAGGDVALGSRFVPGGGMVGAPMWRVAISRVGNMFGRWVLGVPFRDLTTGYRAFRSDVLRAIRLGEDGFAIQLESVIRAYAAGFRVVEVPIVLGTRRHGESHMSYSVALFRGYWLLLMNCRRWLRES